MLLKIIDRGWASDSDIGANILYYLYIERWYWTLSPAGYGSDLHDYINHINIDGHVYGHYVIKSNGGVQFLELCY